MRPSLDQIMAVVASECGMTTLAIKSRCRIRKFCHARDVFFRTARAFRYTLTPIGAAVGRDHSTVQHSLKKPQDELEPHVSRVMQRLLLAREAA